MGRARTGRHFAAAGRAGRASCSRRSSSWWSPYVLPEHLRFIALVVAFAAGIGLERFRHCSFPPLRPCARPRGPGATVLRYEVGYRPARDRAGPARRRRRHPPPLVRLRRRGVAGHHRRYRAHRRDRCPKSLVETEGRRGFVSEGVRFEVTDVGRRVSLVPDVAEQRRHDVAVDIAMENEERGRLQSGTCSTTGCAPRWDASRPRAEHGRRTRRASLPDGTLPEGDRVDSAALVRGPVEERADVALEFEPVPERVTTRPGPARRGARNGRGGARRLAPPPPAATRIRAPSWRQGSWSTDCESETTSRPVSTDASARN